jgi:hypothetical protein
MQLISCTFKGLPRVRNAVISSQRQCLEADVLLIPQGFSQLRSQTPISRNDANLKVDPSVVYGNSSLPRLKPALKFQGSSCSKTTVATAFSSVCDRLRCTL